MTFFNLPTTIITPFAISIIPAISSAGAEGNVSALKKTMDFTFRIVSVICLPCAFGLGVMAKPIISLLFSNPEIYRNAEGGLVYSNFLAAPMLSILAPAILFSGLITVSAAILQASGYERKSILSSCCGVATKALAVWTLVSLPRIGHYGIPLSTLLAYLVMFCFNMYFLSHYLHYRVSFRKILLKPLICACLCGGSAAIVYIALKSSLPGMIATVLAVLVAALVYLISLFRLGGFGKEDVLMLPKGAMVLRVLTRVRLVK